MPILKTQSPEYKFTSDFSANGNKKTFCVIDNHNQINKLSISAKQFYWIAPFTVFRESFIPFFERPHTGDT